MNSPGRREISGLLKALLPALVVICLSAWITADYVAARPVKKTPPKPFVLNRGDGDTINGKLFIYDTYGNDDQLCPSSSMTGQGESNDCGDYSETEWAMTIKWIILYRIIK